MLVTNVNEPPIVSGENMPTFNENGTGRIGRYTASDPEGKSVTWSVAGSERDNFAIDINGYLSFIITPNFEDKSSYFVSIVAADDENLPGSLDVFVTIIDLDEPPAITGDDVLTFAENTDTITVLETYAASDPEGVTSIASWSLVGTDRGDFTISSTGQLQFASTPNYESPADSGGNNVYNVQVRALDGSLSGTKDVTVTVQDLNEEPTVTGDAALSYPENTATTRVLDRYTATDPERSPLTWSVGGTDADAFRIDSSGNLYFDEEPDHESPTDAGGNNVYDLQVVATDDGTLGDRTQSQRGIMSASYDVTVTVTNVDEPPVITGDNTIDDYDENGTGDVATYTADDPEDPQGNNPITWTLGGSDRNDFTIVGGVLKFASTPDYERPADSGRNNHYEVTIYATDSNGERGELEVDAIVKDVDEPPELTGPDTVNDFPENASASRQVARYTASDPEGAAITWSLSGTDDGAFSLNNGTLTFKESPDFEDQPSYSANRERRGRWTDKQQGRNHQHHEHRGGRNRNALHRSAPGRARIPRGRPSRNLTTDLQKRYLAVVPHLQHRQHWHCHHQRNVPLATPRPPPTWAATCAPSRPTTTAHGDGQESIRRQLPIACRHVPPDNGAARMFPVGWRLRSNAASTRTRGPAPTLARKVPGHRRQ